MARKKMMSVVEIILVYSKIKLTFTGSNREHTNASSSEPIHNIGPDVEYRLEKLRTNCSIAFLILLSDNSSPMYGSGTKHKSV